MAGLNPTCAFVPRFVKLAPQGEPMSAIEIEIVPCLSDNYAYLVKSGDFCAVVDPSEPEPVRAALARRGWTPTHILNTHHHLDHTGGNLDLKQEFGAKVVGPAKDAARIPGIDVG